MSAFQSVSSVSSVLHDAGIRFSGGAWLRLKGDGFDAISVNAVSGGWKDHRTGEHGNFHTLAVKLGFDDDGIIIDADAIQKSKAAAESQSEKSRQWARTQWARGISAVKPAREPQQTQSKHEDARDAIYDYLMSRGLDPLPLLPLIKFSTIFNQKSDVDAEMLDAGADFWFMIPMYEIGKAQIAENVCGVQRTYLKFAPDDYHKTEKIGRAMLGRKGVTAIAGHKNPIALPTDRRVLGAGEGFETVASFVQSTGHGGVVAWDWSGLKKWSESINAGQNAPLIAFLVDSDKSETGQRQSAAAVQRINTQEFGKAVYLLPPDSIIPDAKGNRDWNDLLRQSPEDFAAEIVRAWHKSDENLALAPAGKDDDASVIKGYNGPKDAEVKQAIADAVEQHFAFEKMEKAIIQFEADFSEFQQKMEEWKALKKEARKEKGLKKPELPPMLIKITTGVGKSYKIRKLLQQTKLPLLILTRTHELARDYKEADQEKVFAYHGRSNPLVQAKAYTADFVDEHLPEFAESDCFKYPVISLVAENNHVPMLTACRECEHGRKFIVENYDEKSDAYADAIEWFGVNRVDKDTVPPCLWLSHQMAASHSRIVVAPNASFSDSLATWQTPDGPVQRLIIVDEMPDLTRKISANSSDIGNNVANAQKAIKYLQNHNDDDDEEEKEAKEKIINDLENAIEIFKETGKWLGEAMDKGIQKIPDEIIARVEKLHVDWLPGATARWEKAEIKYGREPFIPLRMMRAMIESVGTGTALTEKGILYINEATALDEFINKGKSCILLDATPSRAVESIVKKKGGQIVHAIAKQHINLIHFNQYLHGRTWKNIKHKQAELVRLMGFDEMMQEETGNTPNKLTYMPLCEFADKTDDEKWGYFGRDDIGQDRWKGQDLLIFGGPLFSPLTQAIAYNAELMLMRLAGVKNLPDWSQEIERNQEVVVGNKVVTSKAPLPVDPALREWVLADYARRIAQAIGRVRGVWASPDKPINVWIAGGLPLAGLAEHGVTVTEYRQEKSINLRDKAHKETVEKVQVAIAALQAADQDPSYRAINKWLANHGLPNVRYDAWKSISKASTGPNKDTYEPVDNLLASLDSLQKVADWSGNDISDVALNTWNAPGLDPEIRIAAEIILQVSPNSDKWRQEQRDG